MPARSRDQTSFGPRERRKHCAAHLWLPGNPAVCYRPHCSGVHLGNVGLNVRSLVSFSSWSRQELSLMGDHSFAMTPNRPKSAKK